MYRRSMLAAAGAVAAGLTGCLTSPGGSDGDGDGDGEEPGTTTQTTTTQTTTTNTTTAANPFRTVTVGDPDAVAFPETHRPHLVDVVNDAGARELDVALRDGSSISFREPVAFPAGGRLRLRLAEPIDRELTVDPPGADPTAVPLPAAYVDCNDSRTTVTVDADGRVRHETVSTEMACPPPAVADRSFEAGNGECAGRDAGNASVTFADGTVTATGSLRTPTPCHGAVLEAATVDDATLRIVVAATAPDPGTVCIECVGRVPYEATVTLEHDHPETVVEHVVGDRRSEAARASP